MVTKKKSSTPNRSPDVLNSDNSIKGEVRTYYHLYVDLDEGYFKGYYSTKKRAMEDTEKQGLTKCLNPDSITPVRIFTADGRKGWVLGEESDNPVTLNKGTSFRLW